MFGVEPAQGRQAALELSKVVGGLGIGSALLAFALDALGLNIMRFGALDVPRNAMCFLVFGLLIALFTPRFAHIRTSLVLIIPMLSQFYQVGLAWDYPVGPSSVIRILPYVAVAIAMAAGLWHRPVTPTKPEQLAWIGCLAIGALGLAGGMEFGSSGAFGLFVFGLYLPMTYFYIKSRMTVEDNVSAQIGASGLISFLMFAVGTFVVIRLGSGMEIGGVSGLLGTRNVSDYNLIFAYMLLLWPIALVGASWFGPWLCGGLSMLFIASAVMGLSRTGILMVPLLVVVGLATLYAKQSRSMVQSLAAMGLVGAIAWTMAPNRDTLGIVWAQRFNVGSAAQMLDVANRVRPGGDDSAARDQLRNEALRLWRQEPLIGHGYGGFGAFSVRGYNDAHSASFTTLAENGVLGLAGLYILLGFLALRLGRLATFKAPGPKSLFLMSLVVWVIAVHTVGGNLGVFSEHGFNVNAINGVLLVMYFWVHTLFRDRSGQELVPA